MKYRVIIIIRPFWISPRQILVVPVAPLYNDYAEEVRQLIHNEGFYADSDLSDKKMQKKIRGNMCLTFYLQYRGTISSI